MKKLLSVVLCIAIIASVGTVAMADYDEVGNYETTYNTETGNAVSVTAWADYLFVSTAQALEIYDINTDELVGTWKFTNTQIPSVGTTFKPANVVVTDEYVIIAATTATRGIAIFPNEGHFSDKVPTMIRRIGAAAGTMAFNNVSLMTEKDGYLYVVDRTAAATVNNSTAYKVPKDTVVCWKIDLSNVADFKFNGSANIKYSRLNDADMIEKGYSELVSLGTRDYLWSDIECDGEYIYLATSNNTNYAPYKTLFAERFAIGDEFGAVVDAEDTPDDEKYRPVVYDQTVLEDGFVEGMLLEIISEKTITEDEVKALTVYVQGDEENGQLIGKYGSNTVRGLKIQLNPNTAGGTTLRMYLTSLSTLASDFGCTEADLKNGTVLLATTYDGLEYTYRYNSDSEVRNMGALALGGGYLYAFTNKSTGWRDRQNCNYILISDVSGDDIELKSVDWVAHTAGSIMAKDAVVVGRHLFGLMRGVNYASYLIDISEWPINQNLDNPPYVHGGISLENTAHLLAHGNRIYYPSKEPNFVGVVAIHGSGVSVNVKSDNGYIYGETLSGNDVTVAIDGIEVTASGFGGVYGVPVYELTEGTHTVTVTDGVDFAETTVEVSAEDAGENIIFGETEETVVMTDDPINNIITIEGKSLPNMTVNYKLELSNGGSKTIVAEDIVTCNEEGSYSFKYDYSDDILGDGSKYIITATTLAGTVTYELEVYDAEALNNALSEVRDMNDVTEFKTYLGNNPDFAIALGMDMGEESKYSKLSDSAKTEILTSVFNLIKDNKETDVKTTFENKVNTTYANERKAKALKEINDATSSSLKGILETYKDEYGISDKLWEEYLENEDDWGDINKYFINKSGLPLKSVSAVADKLETAIDKGAEYYANESIGGSGGGGGGGGGGGSSTKGDKDNTNDHAFGVPIKPVVPEKPVEMMSFGDVEKGYWGYEAITSLATRNIIDGIGGGNFAPEATVTREQFVKMLVEALKLKGKGDGITFTDVNPNAWYADYIYIASSIGLAEGYDGSFGVGDGLTREQMATMLYRAANLADIDLEERVEASEFTDSAQIGTYAVDAVKALSQAGIINGIEGGAYAPKTVCTRAMAAKVIYEILAIQ